MDMIDESITSYESVVGMSILDEDGLLPYVVLCEILEDELEVNMGYRGFSSMEVGVRAVGRAKRIMNEEESANIQSLGRNKDAVYRGRTALDDIHLGKFVEWKDDTLDRDGADAAFGYLENVETLLMPSQQSTYATVYDSALQQLTNDNQQQRQFEASSWATLASVENRDDSSSIITQALETTDTVERLRLGLAMILDNQIPESDSESIEFAKSSVDDSQDAFQ